jgi:hypothetical protein
MTDFLKGILSAAGGALVFAAVIFLARRHPREPVLEDLDYDNAHPDGFIDHFKDEK